jgi:hypothetical protein
VDEAACRYTSYNGSLKCGRDVTDESTWKAWTATAQTTPQVADKTSRMYEIGFEVTYIDNTTDTSELEFRDRDCRTGSLPVRDFVYFILGLLS